MNILSTLSSLNKQNKLLNPIFVYLIAYACCIYFGRSVLTDPDSGWHIKAGEIIWKTLSVPYYDTLTFTSDQQWYNLSWLWDIGVYLIYDAFGIEGLTYTQSILFALVLMSIYMAVSSYNQFNKDTVAIVTALGGLVIWDLLYFRPQLISYIFALCILLVLSKRHRLTFYLVPALTLIWANVHGSFIVSYTIIGAFILGNISEKDYKQSVRLSILLFISIAIVIINPLGYKIFIGVGRTVNSAMLVYITEWLPFTFGREYSFTLVVLLILGLGGLNEKSIPITYRILAFCWLIASLQSKRSFGFFAILSLPYFSYMFQKLTTLNPSKYSLSNRIKIVLMMCLIIISILQPLAKFRTDTFHRVPIDAINYLNQKCHNAYLLNDYNFGGYLALWLNPDIKYFIDGRAGTAFSETFIKSYLKGTIDDGDVGAMIQQNSVDAALISNDLKNKSGYISYFADWILAYSDNYATIYFNKNKHGCKK